MAMTPFETYYEYKYIWATGDYDCQGERLLLEMIQRYGYIQQNVNDERLWKEPPEYPELEPETCSFISKEIESEYNRNFRFED